MPQYKHNCDRCTYLGTFFDYDVYRCDESILYRHGNEPHEYGSTAVQCLRDRLTDRTHRISDTDGESHTYQDWLFSGRKKPYCDGSQACLLALAVQAIDRC